MGERIQQTVGVPGKRIEEIGDGTTWGIMAENILEQKFRHHHES